MVRVKEINIGEIPQEWSIGKFGDLAKYDLGRTPPRKEKKYWQNGIYPWVSISDMTEYGTIRDTKEKVSVLAHQQVFRKRLVPKNTVLMSFKLTIGRTSLLAIDAYHNEAIISIYPNESKIIKQFLFYYLPIVDYTQYQDTAVKGKTLNKSKIHKIAIPLPSISEQKNIVNVLSRIRFAIEIQEQIIKTTTELKKTLMQKLFTEGLHGEPQKETEIGLIPKSWEVVTIDNVCEPPQYGFTDTASKHGNTKYLRITDIADFGVNWDTVPYCNCPDIAKYVLKNNDIVVARIGATTGKTYIIKNPPISVFASYLIRLRIKPNMDGNYLYYYCNSRLYWRQINASKNNNLKKGVSGSVLKTMLLPYPPIEEQKQIAKVFEQIDNQNAIHLRKKFILGGLFKSMLHHLMTGQIRVKDIDFGISETA